MKNKVCYHGKKCSSSDVGNNNAFLRHGLGWKGFKKIK